MTRQARLKALERVQTPGGAVTLADVEEDAGREFLERQKKGWDTSRTFGRVHLCKALPDALREDVLARGMNAVYQLAGGLWIASASRGDGQPWQSWAEAALAAYEVASSGAFWPPRGGIKE